VRPIRRWRHGRGLTRSLGLLFATLTVHRVYLLYVRGERRDILLASLLAAGALLSHLAMTLAAAAGCALLFVAYGRSRAGANRSLAVAGQAVTALAALARGR
jgi:hypothetical protein